MSALTPASIRDYSNIAKAIVASAADENGEEQYPRKWNEELSCKDRAETMGATKKFPGT
jgi:hypothetical protein